VDINSVPLNLIKRVFDGPDSSSPWMFCNANRVAKTIAKHHTIPGVVVASSRDSSQVKGLNLADSSGLIGSKKVEVTTTASADHELTSYRTRIEKGTGGVVAVVHTTDQDGTISGKGTCSCVVPVVVYCFTIADKKRSSIC